MSTAAAVCPHCAAPLVSIDDEFCEACGKSVAGDGETSGSASTGPSPPPAVGLPVTAPTAPPGPVRPCVGCGAPPSEIDADRYCERCGLRQPAPRDHQEVDLSVAAGVTDRGLHHHRNEDAMRIGVLPGGGVVVVVCDGVSSSVAPDLASQAAVDAAADLLLETGTAGADQVAGAMLKAAAAAQDAVLAVPWQQEGTLAAPSCTYVAATTYQGTITVSWIGDSRAYWLGQTGVRRLTSDDSWAEEQVEEGSMTEEQAEADSRAHAITRWLGSDAPEGDPQVTTFTPDGAGRLVVCTDGLWNYLGNPEQLAELVEASPASPLATAQALTKFALAAGGHDNVTVVIVDVAAPQEGAA